MKDTLVVTHKELKELCRFRGIRWTLFQLLITMAIFGVLLPLIEPEKWIQGHPLLAIHFVLVPMLLTAPYVADAVAGERERKTLETLLATPLDVRAILLGKGLSIFILAYAQVTMVVLAGLAALNVYFRHTHGHWALYPGPGLFAVFVVSAAFVWFATIAGVFASLRADSARSAHRMAQVANVLLTLLIVFGGIKISVGWRSVMTTFVVVCALDLALAAAAGLACRREQLVAASP